MNINRGVEVFNVSRNSNNQLNLIQIVDVSRASPAESWRESWRESSR